MFAFLVGEGYGTLLAEGRIGRHVVDALAGIGHERIVRRIAIPSKMRLGTVGAYARVRPADRVSPAL